MACRIEYRWNGSNVSFSPPPTPGGTFCPNRFSVLGLGVAVKAM